MKSSYQLAGLLDLVKNTHPIPATEKGHSTSKAKAKNHLSQICDSNISCRADLALICLAKLHLDPDKTCYTWIGGQRATDSRRKIDLESKFFTPKADSPKASRPRISGEALCPHLQAVSTQHLCSLPITSVKFQGHHPRVGEGFLQNLP